MSVESFWAWGEETKQKLEFLSEISERAGSKAPGHLRSLALILLQKRLEAEKHRLRGGILKITRESIVMYVGSNKPENSIWRRAAEGVAHDVQQTELKIAQEEVKAQEIMNSTVSMIASELHQLIKDLMNQKPIFETKSKVYLAMPVDSNPQKVYLGVPVDSHPAESK